MSKITLGELWEELDKNELGTEKAKFKILGYTSTLMGIYGGNRNLIVQDTDGGFMPLSPNEEVEWPIQEKKEKVLYPALVEWPNSFGNQMWNSGEIKYFETEEQAKAILSNCQFGGLKLLQWNPDGYETIPPTKYYKQTTMTEEKQ